VDYRVTSPEAAPCWRTTTAGRQIPHTAEMRLL
jgi:hypothetical protein